MFPLTLKQPAEKLLQTAHERVTHNSQLFGDRFPNYSDTTEYNLNENNNWVAGFWPGLLWLGYGATADVRLRDCAINLLPSFERRLDENIHINHDRGFLFMLSARAQFELANDPEAAALTMRSAEILLNRFRPKGEYIQAWGPVGEPERGGQMIMDTMMNLPLLFWASQHTGDFSYAETALAHAKTMAKYNIRPDGSTYHTYFFDQKTGEPLRGETHQGAADESMWARGQAWGICGYAMVAQSIDLALANSGFAESAGQLAADRTFFIETAYGLARKFMAELPADGVPPWDFWLPDGWPSHRDSSAGAIALVGMLRLAQIDPGNGAEYIGYAQRLFDGLVAHCWDERPEAQGLLLHGASHVPKGLWMDSYLIYGDFFMLEALLMLTGRHTDLWVTDSDTN